MNNLQDSDKVESIEEQLLSLSSDLDVEPSLVLEISRLKEGIDRLKMDKKLLEKMNKNSYSAKKSQIINYQKKQMLG